MFSVNLTFDKTLMMQLAIFFLQKSPLFGLQMCKYSKLNLNTKYFCAQLLQNSTLMHSYCQLSALQRTAMQQRSAKVFKLSFEYLHIYSPTSGDFCRKIAKLHH